MHSPSSLVAAGGEDEAERRREAGAAPGEALAKLTRGERVARTKLSVAEYAETWIETQEGRLRAIRRRPRPGRERSRHQALTVEGHRCHKKGAYEFATSS